jgi:hypothetical protein
MTPLSKNIGKNVTKNKVRVTGNATRGTTKLLKTKTGNVLAVANPYSMARKSKPIT